MLRTSMIYKVPGEICRQYSVEDLQCVESLREPIRSRFDGVGLPATPHAAKGLASGTLRRIATHI